jgi:hypothetical protein
VYDPPGEITCVGICTAYPAVANGEVKPTGQTYVDDVVGIVCNSGYELDDEANSPATCVGEKDREKEGKRGGRERDRD